MWRKERTGKITLEKLRRKEEIEGIKDKVSETTSLSMGVLIKSTTQQLKKSMMQY